MKYSVERTKTVWR